MSEWKDTRYIGNKTSIKYGGINHKLVKNDWRTPPKLLKEIYKTWDINFDPCPFPKPDWNGLEIAWGTKEKPSNAFVNPPYGKETSKWIEKAIYEIGQKNVKTVVFLIHARTDTKWFHEFVLGAAQELLFIKGRVDFINPNGETHHSPFPSLLAVYYSPPLDNQIICESFLWKSGDNERI